MKISVCTAIHNRLHQFRETFEANCQAILANRDVEWIILDYHSSDGLSEFISEKLPVLPRRIRYVRDESERPWHASVAKNLAHFHGNGAVLLNLDCDNYLGDACEVIRSGFAPDIGALHLWSGTHGDGTFGRVAVDREVFQKIGGYDESFFPMGYQDGDLLSRVSASGKTVRRCPCEPRSSIRNDKREAIRHCQIPGITWADMEHANHRRSERNIRLGKIVANAPRPAPDAGGKLSFCTTCMNRRYQLEQTLRENLEAVRQDGNCEIVLVNYNSQDGLDGWIRNDFQNEIETGLLKYVLCPDPESFHACKAKNIAHLSSTGEWLFNLDADQFIGFTCQTIRAAFAYDPGGVVWLWNQIRMAGTYGRIGLSRKNFLRLGGYDESLLPIAYQDTDLIRRAEALGMPILHFPAAAKEFIENFPDEKMANLSEEYKNRPYDQIHKANREISRDNIRRGLLQANVAREPVKTVVNWRSDVYV